MIYTTDGYQEKGNMGAGSIGVSMDAVSMSMTRRSNSTASGSASVTMHGAGLPHAGACSLYGHGVKGSRRDARAPSESQRRRYGVTQPGFTWAVAEYP